MAAVHHLLTVDMLAGIARSMLEMDPEPKRTDDKIFRSHFGVSIPVILILWRKIVAKSPLSSHAEPKHLLWALVFLKCYNSTNVLRRICGWPSESSYVEWTWYFLKRISQLKPDVINLDNRFEGFTGTETCLISVDGIDCLINEPWPFDKKWYSQKFNGPAVKYEIAVCIKTGRIVWSHGPFVASASDATICIGGLITHLAEDEGIEVDGGYKGHNKFKKPETASTREARKQKSVVRGRHENVNSRLKIFDVLNVPFRHLNPRGRMIEKHGYCFHSIAVITELKFENGESLYDVPYDVSYA